MLNVLVYSRNNSRPVILYLQLFLISSLVNNVPFSLVDKSIKADNQNFSVFTRST